MHRIHDVRLSRLPADLPAVSASQMTSSISQFSYLQQARWSRRRPRKCSFFVSNLSSTEMECWHSTVRFSFFECASYSPRPQCPFIHWRCRGCWLKFEMLYSRKYVIICILVSECIEHRPCSCYSPNILITHLSDLLLAKTCR